ncbi:GNAT superfamily N-acetyltransferase [Anoxybacillus tepidamans]|uniref:GNAT superfamily N-acetyltransferase n=1 Tax=Anoxybacteroides tepidamans TaxID=265948 RepID=A0A7W8IM79_9BACL|nr:GNAT family N-acetyltransferase [Anoxybacillus tepidamans]MBB5323093.1 GNAT superfamily N-acetyltransferase [Anoxybacillus tepidamans]
MNVSIRLAREEEAFIVHQVMIAAFEEYRQMDVPSSALNETVDSIRQKLRSGTEQALLCFNSNQPIGTVRFTINGASLYFFRLSVCPKARGKGVAKAMLHWLEDYAKECKVQEIGCRVRASIPKNIYLYESAGYHICEEKIVMSNDVIPVKTVVMKKYLAK